MHKDHPATTIKGQLIGEEGLRQINSRKDWMFDHLRVWGKDQEKKIKHFQLLQAHQLSL